ncbi:MAG: Txe/YoeB family addiction module toxin [Thermoleophilia bacterium]|nr:Txe/YoeB family addiction module toxin [Thermoleophilia bacterium]
MTTSPRTRRWSSHSRLNEKSAKIGKSKPLGQNLSGYWSRRITYEHRLVYTLDGDSLIIIIQARYHY